MPITMSNTARNNNGLFAMLLLYRYFIATRYKPNMEPIRLAANPNEPNKCIGLFV